VAASLSRFAAPAAFLAAVTVAVLLARQVVADDAPSRPAAAATPASTAPPAAPPPAPVRRSAKAPPVDGAFHEIRAGDTLGTVADRYDTSVEALVELNPGVDPVALQVGQRVRVK
jgi:LysM repeat protein